MSALDLLIVSLAVWYTCTVIVYHDGPGGVFAALRKLGKPFACIVCMAVWVSGALVAVHVLLTPYVGIVLAGAGGALLLRSYSGAVHDVG